MHQPLQITFRDVPRSDAVEAAIREHADKLDQFYEDIMSCRVMVEAPHGHHHQGKLYHVRVDLTVPGDELVASRVRDKHHAHEDVYVAIRDAFNAAKRQLQDYKRKQEHHVKVHEVPAHGRIVELDLEHDFGRIESSEGRDIYFHRNSLINEEFDELEIGCEVRFVEETGEQGPQASTVYLEGKHHVTG